MAEERISEVEDMSRETSKTEKAKEKQRGWRWGSQIRTEFLRTVYKRYNICIMGISEGEEREKGTEAPK